MLSSSIETQYLHSIVVKSMLVFHQFKFHVCGLLCDGASTNLALLKQFCNHKNSCNDLTSPWFISPFDGKKVYLIICPSHQVSLFIVNYNYNYYYNWIFCE